MTKTVVLDRVIAVAGWAQTKLDVGTKSKNLNYSNATSTKPGGTYTDTFRFLDASVTY